MENMQKALIMAGSVFMFVIAISVAIYSYNIVMEINDSILTSSANNNTTAEYFTALAEEVERYATRAEIIMAIYGMEKTDYTATKITVNGLTFLKEDFFIEGGRKKIEDNIAKISDIKYSVSYNFMAKGNVEVMYSPAL